MWATSLGTNLGKTMDFLYLYLQKPQAADKRFNMAYFYSGIRCISMLPIPIFEMFSKQVPRLHHHHHPFQSHHHLRRNDSPDSRFPKKRNKPCYTPITRYCEGPDRLIGTMHLKDSITGLATGCLIKRSRFDNFLSK